MQTTRILPVADPEALGHFRPSVSAPLDHWDVDPAAPGLAAVQTAADCLRSTDVPVGFPTETVYGLAADATRSGAVRGIFSVKGRPSDNPLIVHVCDLAMLRMLLGSETTSDDNPMPAIYRPLVARFWPGPLTILLPLPTPLATAPPPSPPRWTLAPEVTAGLQTFGVRLPASALARTLIRLADAPLAAPSANASTRPSPTTAQHVVDDLAGRIAVVLDGGACGVGVESTVVDGLCDPPAVLRPGGVSIAELRTVPGWEQVQRAYPEETGGGRGDENASADAAPAPRAPGMKYKHYSPKARVVLFEGNGQGSRSSSVQAVQSVLETADAADTKRQKKKIVGVIRTSTWTALRESSLVRQAEDGNKEQPIQPSSPNDGTTYTLETLSVAGNNKAVLLERDLGRDVPSIAHGLFSALRDLDARGADVIVVEGVDDRGDDMAGAVMNRLRKAASEVRY